MRGGRKSFAEDEHAELLLTLKKAQQAFMLQN
jgi:hypothetical protein